MAPRTARARSTTPRHACEALVPRLAAANCPPAGADGEAVAAGAGGGVLATPTLEDGAPAANDPVPVTAPVSEGTAASAPVSAPASVSAAGVSGAGLAEAPASEAAPGVMAASPGLSKATANEEPGAGVSTT